MNSAKKAVVLLAEICRQNDISRVVFSPGSRSAPLVIAFSQMTDIACMVIPDERVAGYFALGMAQQTRQTVAVVCTSGTAVLNLGPACAEAFYQHIPLLLLTADRPKGAVEKGENQAINQAFAFKNFTKCSLDMDGDDTSHANIVHVQAQMEMALAITQTPAKGPVHVNVRFSEPLYEIVDDFRIDYTGPVPIQPTIAKTDAKVLANFTKSVRGSARKLIIAGMRSGSEDFRKNITALAQRNDVIVLAETTSNIPAIPGVIYNYDASLDLIPADSSAAFKPELVINCGEQIISKKIKQFIRANKPAVHWHIDEFGEAIGYDMFNIGVQGKLAERDAFDVLINAPQLPAVDFNAKWQALHRKSLQLTQQYLREAKFCDLKVFEALMRSFPAGANIQYGNSSPVRYSNIFSHQQHVSVNSNRGTSGIDGCISTAAGAAYTNGKLTICVVGDISFFYDSNALFNNYLSPQLRIVVINNSGGNIFRFIEGPLKVPGFEKFFETQHHLNASHLAAMYGIPYYFCAHLNELESTLPQFYAAQAGKPAILEIKTDNELSAATYKGYSAYLKNNL